MEGKPVLVEMAGPMSMAILILGVFTALTSVMGIEEGLMAKGWAYVTVVVGVGLILAGGLWSRGHIKKVRRFEVLVTERSKANFLRNQEELEYLAWQLPSSYEERLMAKKKDFGVK